MNKIVSDDFEKLLCEYGDKLEKLRDCSILITGANGMITTYLSDFLAYIAEAHNLQLYLQCRNIGKAEKAFWQYLSKDWFHLVGFDFENNKIPDIRFDYILHAASPASTKSFVESPVDVISPNVIGTWYLLQHARRGVRKFLLFSSNSIYGEGGTDKTILAENDYGIVDPLNDRSSYIESKRLSEQMGAAFWRQHKVPVSIIRICHTYGPTFDLKRDTRIIPRVIKQILEGEDIEIYRDPDSVIQYTYIADMIAAILLVMLEGEDGGAYNSGGDEIVKMDDVIEWMVNADPCIRSALVEKEPDQNYRFGKGKGINFVKLSNYKLKALGWKQLYSNKEGFTRMVRYYLEENGYPDGDNHSGDC